MQGGHQAVDVPVFGIAFWRDVGVDELVDHIAADAADVGRNVIRLHQVAALLVNVLALIIRHVIELQQLLADIEVATFHFALGIFDGLGHPRMLDGLAFLHAEFLHEAGDPVRGKNTHEVIFQRQVEPAGARITLTAGTAAQLVVDTARLVAFGAHNMQAAGGKHFVVSGSPFITHPLPISIGGARRQRGQFRFQTAAEHDVGTATRHIGGHRHTAGTTGLGHDLRFLFVELGVEHLVRNALLAEQV